MAIRTPDAGAGAKTVALLYLLVAALCGNAVAQAQRVREHRNQIEFPTRGGVLLMDASFPVAGDPVSAMIVVHGGGWEAGDRRTYVGPLLHWLEQSRYAWFSVDYRLAPAHPYPAAVEDVQDALAWIHRNAAQFRVDPKRLVLAGESSGGHLVSLVGGITGTPLAGVISFYGIHNFATWFGPDNPPRRNAALFLQLDARPLREQPALAKAIVRQASPVSHVHRGMPPFLLIHGEKDTGVPVAQSEEMCEAIRGAGAACEMFVLPGAGHGMENWERDPALGAWKTAMASWLQRIVKR